MLTISESRLLRVLIALRDATGAKTRTPVAESLVAALLRDDADFTGSVSDELDDLERQGFAQIGRGAPGAREVQMTAPGKIKAEEFHRLSSRSPMPSAPRSARTANDDPMNGQPAPASTSEDWRLSAGEVLDAVTQAITQLPPDTMSTVRVLIEDARRCLADDSRARARRALTALGAYLGDAASGALANVVSAQMLALVLRLGE
jgi:hypothetical protein